MNGWTLTRVWQVDHKLVVANSIEEAIELYKSYVGEQYGDTIRVIKAVGTDTTISEYDAIVKDN